MDGVEGVLVRSSVNACMLCLFITVYVCIGVYANYDLCINNSLIIKLILFIHEFQNYYFLHLIPLNTNEADLSITDSAWLLLS